MATLNYVAIDLGAESGRAMLGQFDGQRLRLSEAHRFPNIPVQAGLESRALKYRWVLENLEAVLGRRLEPIHIIGGGAQNGLLCQFTADATGRPVVAGPTEATAIGNVLMLAKALRHVATLAEGRDLVRRSFELVTYEPGPAAGWEAAYARFQALLATS
jgi:rhamnulokinase